MNVNETGNYKQKRNKFYKYHEWQCLAMWIRYYSVKRKQTKQKKKKQDISENLRELEINFKKRTHHRKPILIYIVSTTWMEFFSLTLCLGNYRMSYKRSKWFDFGCRSIYCSSNCEDNISSNKIESKIEFVRDVCICEITLSEIMDID